MANIWILGYDSPTRQAVVKLSTEITESMKSLKIEEAVITFVPSVVLEAISREPSPYIIVSSTCPNEADRIIDELRARNVRIDMERNIVDRFIPKKVGF